ncbi:MAG: GvpL/GvpF family gas vesicle protein [Candidatus Omnitrophota bacterium]|nr:GvpL/GvpF family gas vesicle protein [Candidatus Omnitrophota bacterium]
MVIYTYGVIDSKDTIDETIFGLEGVGVHNVSYRDIGVAVSELRQKLQEITDADVLKHEEVIETLMTKFTVLPIRLSTIFNTKENLLSMAELYYEDFKDNLARLHNKAEFGIKVIWSADTIKQRIIDAYQKTKHNVSISSESPAKTFVKEKFEKHIIDKEFQEEANRCIAVVDDYFNKIACEKKLKRLQTENLLLNASYLVDKQRQNEFRQAFEQLKNTPGDLKFLFSGPWPCYNFVTLTRKPASVDYFNTEDMLNRLLAQQGLAQERNSV